MVTTIFVLLVVFQLKHFLADYPLQTRYMLGKFKPGLGYVLPLFLHASVHAAFTFLICWTFSSFWFAVVAAVFDHTVHFLMDRLKASPSLLGKHKPLTAKEYPCASEEGKRGNKYFWWSLGFDQGVHHLTHYVIIATLLALR